MVTDRYTLEREIGRGGTGTVWLATDELLARQVAIKRIGLAPGAADPDTERVEREARLSAMLNHPHVVAVYDLVKEGDEDWLVMEYVDGPSLAGLIRRDGPFTADRAAPLFLDAARALEAAHEAGIVHRDVKPSNLLVSESGEAKLTDFGIARAESDPALTQTGMVTGSPAYLSPEIASGRTATAQSDVWSLGASLFHALSGRPPYEVGDNLLGAMYRIVHEPPPRLADAGWLAPLLEGTMTHDPEARWTMTQVREFLSTRGAAAPVVSAAVPAPAPPVADEPATRTALVEPARQRRGAPRRPSLATLLAALLALLLVVAVGWIWWDTRPGGQPTPPVAAPPASETPAPEPAAPTPEEMTDFIESYIPMAVEETRQAFDTSLTPEFQAESGYYEGYRDFWGTVRSAEISNVQADVEQMVVSYRVSYVFKDRGRSEEDVRLQLAYQDGRYLIAGEG